MNYLRFAPILILAFSACGSGGGAPSSGENNNNSVPGTSPSIPVWRVEVEGDGTSFSLSMITDGGIPSGGHEQSQGPAIPVPAGQIVAYEVSGTVFTSGGVTRDGGVNVAVGGVWQSIRLYKNGVQILSASLSTNGTYTDFGSH